AQPFNGERGGVRQLQVHIPLVIPPVIDHPEVTLLRPSTDRPVLDVTHIWIGGDRPLQERPDLAMPATGPHHRVPNGVVRLPRVRPSRIRIRHPLRGVVLNDRIVLHGPLKVQGTSTYAT